MRLGTTSSCFPLDHWHLTAAQHCVMPSFSLLVVCARCKKLDRCCTVLQSFRGVYYCAVEIYYISTCRMTSDQDIPVGP